ncbi:restriction endonuclease subunit S [Xanthomonas arboricola]|uniref:restriction endonuclease subunit S n=1 Tax=Xanthomonas arboricola TaxID=56448 RepID=UPI00137B914A|nr:restriction endonuclease subunit S [Xanthomonas arboricola]
MKKTAGQKGVPQLRFPGFDGEWSLKKLGDEGKFLSSLMGKKGDDFGVGGAKFITYMNVFANTFVNTSDLRAVRVDEGESQNPVKKGDLLFTISSETPEDAGMSSVLLDDVANCYVNSFCAIFRFDEGRSPDPIFTGYFLRRPAGRAYFSAKAQGSTRFNLSKAAFQSVPLLVPRVGEQKKIADCLSSLDACIAAEIRKLDALKVYKLGLIQRLFPAEGERLPCLRFPGFDGVWQESQLASCIQTVAPPKKLQTSEYMAQGCYPIIDQSQGPIAGWTDDKDSLVEGPFPLIVFGDHTCMLKLATRLFAQGADGIKIFFAKKDVSTGFLYQFLSARPLVMQEYRRHFSILKEKHVLFPVDPEEQRCIFNVLSGLDDLIIAQSGKIFALQQHKRGLMQGLFPAMEASTP